MFPRASCSSLLWEMVYWEARRFVWLLHTWFTVAVLPYLTREPQSIFARLTYKEENKVWRPVCFIRSTIWRGFPSLQIAAIESAECFSFIVPCWRYTENSSLTSITTYYNSSSLHPLLLRRREFSLWSACAPESSWVSALLLDEGVIIQPLEYVTVSQVVLPVN